MLLRVCGTPCGQSAVAIYKQLHDYRTGSRVHDVMTSIAQALEDAIRRTQGVAGAARIVPWYQDFTLGAPKYTAEHVRAQIRSGYASGIHSWVLWNPRSRYTRAALLPVGGNSRDSISGRDSVAFRRDTGVVRRDSAAKRDSAQH